MSSFVVIPARLASTRLPNKLLLAETGLPLIQHTYQAAVQARLPMGICVAADHEEIARAVRDFGGNVVLTNPAATSGTDRVAEIAEQRADIDIFVNVQGDEPEIEPAAIDHVIELLQGHQSAAVATLATPIRNRRQLEDPACVKVVLNRAGEAMYFSRSVIPYPRNWSDDLLRNDTFLQHVGLYAYRRDFLLSLARIAPAKSEKLESLEQLRVLDTGHSIAVGVVERAANGIDTRADYEAFVRRAA